MQKNTEYSIVIEPLSLEDGGGWLATVPELAGCMGDGASQIDALNDALDAIEEWKDAAKLLDKPIPKPTLGQWSQRVPRSLHEKLKIIAANEGVSLNHYVTTVLSHAASQK